MSAPTVNYDPATQTSVLSVSYVVGLALSSTGPFYDIAAANNATSTQVTFPGTVTYAAAVASAVSQIQATEGIGGILDESNALIAPLGATRPITINYIKLTQTKPLSDGVTQNIDVTWLVGGYSIVLGARVFKDYPGIAQGPLGDGNAEEVIANFSSTWPAMLIDTAIAVNAIESLGIDGDVVVDASYNQIWPVEHTTPARMVLS